MLSRVLVWLLCPPAPTVSISVSTFGIDKGFPMSVAGIHFLADDDSEMKTASELKTTRSKDDNLQNHLFTVINSS